MGCCEGETASAAGAALPRAALDTSHGVSFAVEVEAGRVVGAGLDLVGRESERELVPWVVSCLEQEGLRLADVRAWTVGTGPGSFTGIRVGIAFVRGVCRWSGGTCRGVPSSFALAAAAVGGCPVGGRIGALHDARRGQVIVTVYECGAEAGMVARSPARLVPGDELAGALSECTRLVTVHADRIGALVPEPLRERLVCLPGVDATLLLRKRASGTEGPDSAVDSSLEPVYVRPAVFVAPRPLPRRIGLLRDEV